MILDIDKHNLYLFSVYSVHFRDINFTLCFCLFDLILYILVNNFFSYVGMGHPGLNQY